MNPKHRRKITIRGTRNHQVQMTKHPAQVISSVCHQYRLQAVETNQDFVKNQNQKLRTIASSF